MRLTLGVKSDSVEYRFSYDWLFGLMRRSGVTLMQLGSFFELYSLPDEYFVELRRAADAAGVRIKSCFTAHRELGGFFTGNPHMEKVARKNYERFIEVAAVLGAEHVGSNPGAIYRDRMRDKDAGIECYLRHMRELMQFAHSAGVKGLTVEPMSCLAEPPTTAAEIRSMMSSLADWHARHSDTVPVYLCGDISHGFADREGRVAEGNFELFEAGIPYMAEFHFKNTDAKFHSTFGFGAAELARGIVDLPRLRELIAAHDGEWALEEVTGYLELSGPKLGREYTDYLLEEALSESLAELKRRFDGMN